MYRAWYPAGGEYPLYYIDPDTCIDCGACVPACPFNAIFPESDVPAAYTAKGGEYVSRVGLTGHYEGTNDHGVPVVLDCTKQLAAGDVEDLTPDIATRPTTRTKPKPRSGNLPRWNFQNHLLYLQEAIFFDWAACASYSTLENVFINRIFFLFGRGFHGLHGFFLWLFP